MDQTLLLGSVFENKHQVAPRLRKNRASGNGSSKWLTSMHGPLNLRPKLVINGNISLIALTTWTA